MENSISICEALALENPIVDVRSEKEFAKGHIPGAFNVPLLKNKEREIIGKEYKRRGGEAAEKLGYQIVSPRFPEIQQQLRKIGKKITIQCWRGGKRSTISCDLAQKVHLESVYIAGGYRSYRRWCHRVFRRPKNIYAISGKTGSGKTELLDMLRKRGHQTLDLEHLANHKGSVFGALGKPTQPTQEMFENKLAFLWDLLHCSQPLFIENESRMIGKIFIPEDLFQQIKRSTTIEVELPENMRQERIFREYGHFPKEKLLECAHKLKKRIGGLRFQKVASSLEKNDREWINILLDYYDSCYLYHRKKHQQKVTYSIQGRSLKELCEKLQKFTMEQ